MANVQDYLTLASEAEDLAALRIPVIVITQTGDRDHAAHLGRGVPGGQHGVVLVVTTDGCSLSFLCGLRQACEPGAVSFSGTALFGASSNDPAGVRADRT